MDLYFIGINVLAFFLYYLDKQKSLLKKRRIRESTLLIVSFMGGSFLGYLGMFMFHHKTRKWYFHVVNLVSIVLYSYFFYCVGRSL